MKISRLLSGMLFFLLILTVSCKKEEINDDTLSYSSYLPLEVGNYWIYERVRIEPDGTEIVEGMDSCYIRKDTVMRGNTYYEYVKPELRKEVLILIRDSLHYIVGNNGTILFSSEEFEKEFDEFQDDFTTYSRRMVEGIKQVTVPAGTFNSLLLQEIFKIIIPSETTDGRYVYLDHYYVKGIGVVKENALKYISQDHDYERRLVRYYVGE